MKSVIAVIPNLTPKQALNTFSRIMAADTELNWDPGLTSGKLIEFKSLVMLGRATKIPLVGTWTREKLKQVAETANWDFIIRYSDRGSYWSARRFFEAAVRERYHIIFIPRTRTISKILKNNESKNTLPGC